jgi:hypothetical protein
MDPNFSWPEDVKRYLDENKAKDTLLEMHETCWQKTFATLVHICLSAVSLFRMLKFIVETR